MNRALVAAAVCLSLCGCSLLHKPDKTVADDAGASWTYHDARYQRFCIGTKDFPVADAPPWCDAYKKAIDELGWQWNTADDVRKLGALPPEEKKAIADAMKAVAK